MFNHRKQFWTIILTVIGIVYTFPNIFAQDGVPKVSTGQEYENKTYIGFQLGGISSGFFGNIPDLNSKKEIQKINYGFIAEYQFHSNYIIEFNLGLAKLGYKMNANLIGTDTSDGKNYVVGNYNFNITRYYIDVITKINYLFGSPDKKARFSIGGGIIQSFVSGGRESATYYYYPNYIPRKININYFGMRGKKMDENMDISVIITLGYRFQVGKKTFIKTDVFGRIGLVDRVEESRMNEHINLYGYGVNLAVGVKL